MARALTVKAVEAMKPGAARREVADGALPGLYLVVQPSGAMSWAVRYRYGGRPRKVTLGSFPAFGLADARKSGGAVLRSVSEGRDPASERMRAKVERLDGRNLVETVLDTFIARHVKLRNRKSTATETERYVDNVLRPRWKGRQVQDITKRDVLDLLDEIIARGTPAAANRIHAIVCKFFNWCVEKGVLAMSPAAGLKAPAENVAGDRALSHYEIRLFWRACHNVGWPFGPMFKLLLLTGQRRDEVAGASWREIDTSGVGAVWMIPKERAKNGKAHAVPLADAVLGLLGGLPRVESDARHVSRQMARRTSAGIAGPKPGWTRPC
jgi:integrase